MLISPKELSQDALRGLAEDFLTSGADQYFGNLAIEIPKVVALIEKGELFIAYSLVDHSIALKYKNDIPFIQKAAS